MTTFATSVDAGSRSRRWLGYAGLLPFAGCLAIMLLADDRGWQTVAAAQLLFYAALIASFLGAVHWGTVLAKVSARQPTRLAWGVTPALLAWPLLNLPIDIALAGFAALFGLILLVDYCLLPLPDGDYRRLRLRLSAFVISCLLGAALVAPGVS